MKAMTVYNKLKIAILAIIASQSVSAIQLDPIQIQSSSGDLLYAEMKFSNSNPNEKIDVNLASAEDMMNIRASHQPPGHLNFFTRRSGDGSGVIVITSSRPVIEPELNILLKIQEGSSTYIQQVKASLPRTKTATPPMAMPSNETALTPQMIVSEKDIALNLPESASLQPSQPVKQDTAIANNLAISTVALPALSTATNTANTSSASQPSIQNNNPHQIREDREATRAAFLKHHPVPTEKTETAQVSPKPIPQQHMAQVNPKAKPQPQTTNKPQNTQATPQAKAASAAIKGQHTVQANESLWSIASKIAAKTKQSIPEVMRQLQANNPQAFVQGNPNRLRQGVALNLAQPMPNAQQKFKPAPPQTAQQRANTKTKYRLNQAEMSIVADQKPLQTTSAAHQNGLQKTTSAELSVKVMTAREKTVKLQNHVTQLSSALNQKNNRIQLLNARLAQIQQQLQQQAQARKPK